MQTRSRHLTNLSRGVASDTDTIPLVLPASDAGPQGFVRLINRSPQSGEVSITAIDDNGRRFGPVSLSLDAKGAAQFNSGDLEEGNPGIGLSTGVGGGTGNWRLELDTTLDIEPLAYVRTTDGFLTSMHDVASEEAPLSYRVPIFNPGSNRSLVSSVRLVNPGDRVADVTIGAVDARGNPAPMGDVRLGLPAGAAHMFSAQDLEEGSSEFTGRFGKGTGKWQLSVTSDAPLLVMGLMQTRSGHLTNLSTTPQRPPPLDHSDTPEGATDITNLGSIHGTMDSSDDVDYFTFTLTEEAEVEIELLVEPGFEDAVFGIALLDNEGNIVDEVRTDTAVSTLRSKAGSDSAASVARAAATPKGWQLLLNPTVLKALKWVIKVFVVGPVLDDPVGTYKLVKHLVTGDHCPRLQERPPQLFASVYAGDQSDTVDLRNFIWTPEHIPLEFRVVSVTPEGLYTDLREHRLRFGAPQRTAP